MFNLKKTLCFTVAVVVAIGFSGCKVEKTQEGELPDVDVDVKGGQLPKYDVEGPDVDVDTKEVTVPVPDVDVEVKKKEATIEVPDIDVDMPGNDNNAADVPGTE